jgi:hypothetical protein
MMTKLISCIIALENHMLMRALVFLLALAAALPVGAQFSYPASASRVIGFAQLADGGPINDRWSTTFTFTNLSSTTSNPMKVYFYGNNGLPLALDFGQGPSTTLNLTLVPGGVKSVTSTGTSSTLVEGWALVNYAELPITGVATYRSSNNGVTGGDVAAIGAGSTFFYSSYATERLGVAVVNPSATSTINLRISAVDQDGVGKGSYDVLLLPPHGHQSFVLYTKIPGLLTPGFTGSITITPLDDPPLPFGAWTLNSRNDFLSTLPPGEMTTPGPHNRRPYDIIVMVQNAGRVVLQAEPGLLGSSPTVVSGVLGGLNFMVDSDPAINASCVMVNYGGQVHVTTGLIEALGASDAALAFIVAHKSMHAIYDGLATTRNGPCIAAPSGAYASDPEGLADAAAEAILLQAGFDPGGAADFYHRLLYASTQGLPVDASLKTEFGIPNDIPARLAKLWNYIGLSCAPSGGLGPICAKARKYWHPQNPANIP